MLSKQPISQNLMANCVLIAILILAAWLRITTVAETKVIAPVRADAAQYIAYAHNLETQGIYSRQLPGSSGQILPDAVRSPGYPLFLTLFIDDLDAEELQAAVWAQVALSLLTVLFCYLLCRLCLGTSTALIAALLTAISPHLINANIYLLTETIFAFLLILGIYLIGLAYDKHKVWLWICAGITIAASALVRPIMQYFVLALPLLLLFHDDKRAPWKGFIWFTVGFLAIYSWWPIRNLATLGLWSDPRLMINFFHHGHYPYFMYEKNPLTFGFPYRADPMSAELGASIGSAVAGIWARIIADPATYLQWFLLGKPIAFWSWGIVNGAGGIFIYSVSASPFLDGDLLPFLLQGMRLLHPFILLAALLCLGIIFLSSVRKHLSHGSLFSIQLTLFVLIYFTGLHMIGAPFPRYSIPLRPLLYIAACATVYLLWLGIGRHKKQQENE